MRTIKKIGIVIFFLAVFIAALWYFLPWQTLGIYAIDRASLNAAQNGIYISYVDFDSSGVVTPTYSMRSLDVESPFARVSLSNPRVQVLPFRSLFSGGASIYLEFDGGVLTVIPNNVMQLNSGRMSLDASGTAIAVSNLEVTGDFQVTGEIDYSLANRRIAHSTVIFKLPDNMSAMLNNPMLSRFVESVGPGEWRLKYNASTN